MLLMALECISVCVWTGDVRALSHIYAKLLVLEFTVDDNMKNTFAEKMSWHISHKPSWWFNNFYPPLRQYHSVDAVARSEMVMERLRPRSDGVRDARKCWCIKDGSDSVLLPPPVQQWCSGSTTLPTVTLTWCSDRPGAERWETRQGLNFFLELLLFATFCPYNQT